jgi:hypothetical protein
MPRALEDNSSQRVWTNGGGAAVVSGTIVQSADGKAGIVVGGASVPVGGKRAIDVDRVVVITKASNVDIAAGAKVKIVAATQIAGIGAPGSGEFTVGRAIYAAGTGTTEVQVALNDQGATPDAT